MKNNEILSDVNIYYSDMFKKYGQTPQGVDWNSESSQHFRFEILSDVIRENQCFSIIDYGCGYGAMFDYFKKKYSNFNFIGYDISQIMIHQAIENHKDEKNTNWFSDINLIPKSDYIISSGIFNVKLNNTNTEWLKYCLETMHIINDRTIKGFSFNMLTKYSESSFMKDNLYYADPLYIFDYCKKNFSKYVALKHDYPLYEFTIIVRK
jgi:SAM-dependent methyltransferase